MSNKPLQLWVITEGRAGHVSMLLGFCRRLEARMAIETRWLDVSKTPFRYRGRDALLAQFGATEKPDWVLGTGSHCHFPLIWTRWVMGARSIVLQCPRIPLALFDVVVAPEHDAPRKSPHIFVSQGVLNKIEPVTEGRNPGRGLVLLGGINKHFDWNDAAVVAQVTAIAKAQPHVRWCVSDSPRTPEGVLDQIAQQKLDNVELVPFSECGVDWLQQQLAAAGQVWVSRDSVSMVYEGLSAAAPTGLLHLAPLRDSRVTRCMEGVLERGLATAYESADLTRPLPPPAAPLRETERAVDWFINFAGLTARAATGDNIGG